MPTPPAARPESPGRLLRSALATRWGDNVVAFCGAAGHQSGEALVPVIVGMALDQGVAAGDPVRLAWWLLAACAAFVLLSNSYMIYARVANRSSTAAAVRLRLRVADHLLDDRGTAEQSHAAGGLTSIASGDVTLVSSVNQVIFLLAAGLGGFLVAAVALFRTDVVLGLVVVLGAIPVVAGMHLLGVPLERRFVEERARAAAASDTAADLITGLRVVKGLGAEATAGRRFRVVSRDALRATMRSARFGASFEAVSVLVTGLFVALVAVLAGRMALRGEITIGALVAALGLAQYLVVPLRQLSATTALWAQCHAAAVRVATVLGRPAPLFGARGPAGEFAGEVGIATLAGPIVARPGEMTGLVTDQRTTAELLAALTGSSRPATARVGLDGIPLEEIRVDLLRQSMVVVPHESSLFEGTLAENVRAAARDEATAAAAVWAAAVDSITAELPDGADTPVGEAGHMLSGGQRQRVALARALARAPRVLVLHEPTSAVDSVTEARIAERVRELRRGSTTVLLTTSPSLLASCDRVVWLDADRIVDGAHHRLATRHAAYAEAVLR